MTDIILIGAGGCMRELAWQIFESNRIKKEWNIVGYVDKSSDTEVSSVEVAGIAIPYLGDDDYLLNSSKDVNVILSVGNPHFRKKLVEMYKYNSHIKFPNLVLQNAKVCKDVKMGQGCIVSMDSKISTNVKLGDFVFINMDSTVCHDGVLGDYVSVNPAVKLAGAVNVGNETEIGLGANVIQGITIGRDVVIGAGSVIIRDTQDSCTIAGIPGRKVR